MKKPSPPLLIAAAVLALFSACGKDSVYVVTIVGRVIDSAGKGAASAQVSIPAGQLCCPGDQVCTYTTDWAGRWGYTFEPEYGNPYPYKCNYTVKKAGEEAETSASFEYCARGKECSTTVVETKVVLE